MNVFAVAAFRSRQQVLYFEDIFSREGVPVQIVSTPHEIAAGCGLSLMFPIGYTPQAQQLIHRYRPTNLIGLYRIEEGDGKRRLTALAK